MRLSKQHELILLILLSKKPNAVSFREIFHITYRLKIDRWERPTGDVLPPRGTVLTSSLSRSLRTLHEKKLVRQGKSSIFNIGCSWYLTPKGYDVSREVKRENECKIQDLEKKLIELNDLKSIFK